MSSHNSKKDNPINILKTNNITITPQISNLLNTCKAKQLDYRILIEGDKDIDKVVDVKRMTIVVDKSGNLLKHYYG